jgi:hypothetical protein
MEPRTLCPHCHQPIRSPVRLGVSLPPRKAALFDAVKAAGDVGISSAELRTQVWDGKRCPHNVKSHMWQINTMIESTGYRITADGRGRFARWSLVDRRKA